MKLGDLLDARLPRRAGSQRGALAFPTDPAERNRWILAAIALGLLIYAYGIDKTCVANERALSLFGWLAGYWGTGADFAHGWVVPIVSVGLVVWRWKKKLHALPMESATAGLGMVGLGWLMYWVGVRAANPRVMAVSLPVLLFGLIWYLAGWKWAKELWFACAFLLFMIPLNFLEARVAFPLRMFVTTFAVKILNVFGMDVMQNGTAILSVKNTFEPLDVADPCSGIRSLIALMALTSIYGYTTMDKWWKKWILFLSCIPLAVIGNLARIVTIAFVAQGFGQETAMPLYHDYSGYIVFSLAILCMIAIGSLLNVHYRDLVYRWTREEVTTPRPAR